MSVASSIPYIKIPNPSSSSSSSPSSSSSTTSTTSCFRFATTTKACTLTVRSSQAEGPIRRPVAPLREPSPPLKPPVPPSSSPPSSPVAPPPPKPAAQVALEDKNVITLEFQRQKAKELQEYFKQKKLEEADKGPFFGFLGKNEIANGR